MNLHHRADQAELRARLLDRLRPLATNPRVARAAPGQRSRGPGVFSYCCVTAERLAEVRLDHPVLGVLLYGTKEVWLGSTCWTLGPGDVFVLPSGVDLDAVNVPDPRRSLYESLLLEVAALPAAVPPIKTGGPRTGRRDIGIPLTPDLVDSIGHAAITLTDATHAPSLSALRMTEMLILLRGVTQAWPLFATSLGEQVRWLVLSSPERRWTGADLARQLGLGASTLRRRLAGEGTSLRQVVEGARMQVAHDVLISKAGTVALAIEAAGYASRSHFARAYRRRYDVLPSKTRRSEKQSA